MTKLATTITVGLARPFWAGSVAVFAFACVGSGAVAISTAIISANRHTVSAFRIQSIPFFTNTLATITISILTANRASWYAETAEVLDMVREASAGFWLSAESIHAFVGTDGITKFVVVNISDVAFAA